MTMNQETIKEHKKLSDEDIVKIAHTVDQLVIDIGEVYGPSGIQLASIMLGRLMVFTQQIGEYDTFHNLMKEIVKMGADREVNRQESP
jgi:hypothetical protein